MNPETTRHDSWRSLENTVEIKEHVCREKLVRPSGSEADVKRAKCTNVVSGKRQTANGTRQTAHGNRQTANGKLQTGNGKRQTANAKRQSQNANLALHFVVRDQHGNMHIYTSRKLTRISPPFSESRLPFPSLSQCR